jgi:cysteine-rich repeat protein
MRIRTAIVIGITAWACGDNLQLPRQDAGPDGGIDIKCGNGRLDEHEDCDDGEANGGPGARCDANCRWSCLDDSWCTDGEPCNGEETCVDHACVPGTDLPDGAVCGTGKLCRNAACTDAICGDQFVTGPAEECDDANTDPDDGCDNDCRYTCVSTDSTRDCTPADACAGQGTCDDTTHTCTPGTPLANDTPCGTSGYCKDGTCTQPTCGNGVTEPGEDCDLGASNGVPGSGCDADCTWSCVDPATDCAAAPACHQQSCNNSHVCTPIADPTQDGMPCGTDLVCNNGACVVADAECGNGVVELGEDCDFGLSNGPGTGCESNCLFSCTILPDSCDDGNPCNGTEVCTMIQVNGADGQKCTSTAAPSPGTACGTNQICLNQLCVASTCGDGYVDADRGETCEPPNTPTCDALCHTIACGDGIRAGTEQCDDGNLVNLDGCSATCTFEQDHRANSLSMPFTTTSYCTSNALGGAIVGSLARNEITGALASGVKDGSITIMFAALGLDDLTGTNDPALALGVLTGTPVTGATTYDGNNDLDWWYTTAASTIDTTRVPISQVAASITAKVLDAGPEDILVTISLAGVPATLEMLSAKLRANIGGTSTPLASTGGTPGHLASENLDPTLVSFATMTGGQLCGNVTAQSLANVPAPDALVGCTFLTCSQCYTANHTLLDILVGGCNTLLGQQIKATQPDKSRDPPAVYLLTTTNRYVTGCTKNGIPAQLSECLANAAYSSAFGFTTDRVIAK